MDRNDWAREEIKQIYETPLLKLIFQASGIHQQYHPAGEIQLCMLLSVKTGNCSEDCAYCPQSAHNQTGVKSNALDKEAILQGARRAKELGCSRLCLGSSGREVRNNGVFQLLLECVPEIRKIGLEVCCSLGMMHDEQAKQLKEAGVSAYNHNIDSSESFYSKIITTRTYQDRLDTLESVRNAKMAVCTGGIIGMGESDEDRIDFLHTLATLPQHPESVPINALIPIKGTPLENQTKRVSVWEMLRVIAAARIVMPKALIRLSAGRSFFSQVEQTLFFLAGANSLHTGEKLLTAPNCGIENDEILREILGFIPMKSPLQ